MTLGLQMLCRKVRTARSRVAIISAALLVSACGHDRDLAQPNTAAKVFHIDCSSDAGGDGSVERPWNALDQVNDAVLTAGDQVLLHAGTTCTGMLAPRGSGTETSPIIIGTYGSGSSGRIDANGVAPAALQLNDMSYVIAQDLELTNQGDTSNPHHGVFITATDTAVRGITVRRMYVHNVDGPVAFNDVAKHGGGIIMQNLGSGSGRFDDVLIEDNRVEDVARSGMFLNGGPSTARPRATEPWPEAATGLRVRNNHLTRLAGDGIVALGTVDAVIEDNVVSVGNLSGQNYLDFQNRNCSAGIWAFNANGTLIQRNEVFGFVFGQSSTNGCDGTGFDIDYNQDETIIQYNFSHDNEGGFILLCSDDQPRTAAVRYNLSLDDGHSFSASPCKAPTLGGFDGLRFFNNTFVAANPNTSAESLPLPTLYNAGTFVFSNNIIYATQQQFVPLQCGNSCSNNLFFNIAPSGSDAISGDPLFVEATRRGEGRLQTGDAFELLPGSPAIGAGAPIEGGVAEDYFGNPVPVASPTIGFFQPQ